MLGNTPASTAAFSLDAPRAIASQNRTRCSRRPQADVHPNAFQPQQHDSTPGFSSASQLLNLRRCDNQLWAGPGSTETWFVGFLLFCSSE